MEFGNQDKSTQIHEFKKVVEATQDEWVKINQDQAVLMLCTGEYVIEEAGECWRNGHKTGGRKKVTVNLGYMEKLKIFDNFSDFNFERIIVFWTV